MKDEHYYQQFQRKTYLRTDYRSDQGYGHEWNNKTRRSSAIHAAFGKRTSDREFVKEEQLKAVESHLQAAIDAARQYGMSQEELIGVVKMLYEEM